MPQYKLLLQAHETAEFGRLAGFDQDAAESALKDLTEFAASSGAEQLMDVLQEPMAQPIFEAVFGNSPFLTRISRRNPNFLGQLMALGPDESLQNILAKIGSLLPSLPEADMMTSLRQAREELALTVALADVTGIWQLRKVTGALTAFVDAALTATTAHLLCRMHEAGSLKLKNGTSTDQNQVAVDCGLFILGMGKLGSFELNYSSDIDLIVLYDAEKVPCQSGDGPRALMVNFVQDLIRVIQTQTADGYVHRIDLRLRPDPASTPAAISTEFAEGYYESRGRNWERAAMIKARTVAGDLAAGKSFLKMMEPFVWRRHLDYAAIEDIRGITRQLQSSNRQKGIKTRDHDIKIGAGGIREIEFYVQTQQLVVGGRNPRLRAAATMSALAEMPDRDGENVSADLMSAYEFLRRLEHRLQMINDEQTHLMPADDEAFNRVAMFMGFSSPAEFEEELRQILETVHNHYLAQFPEISAAPEAIHLLLQADGSVPETVAYLEARGYSAPLRVLAILNGWQDRNYRVLQNDRTHELLNDLLPTIVESFGGCLDPDLGLQRFDEFIRNLPAGVQLFSLIHANPWLLELISDVFGTAPAIAEKLSRHNEMFDALLTADFYEPVPARNDLEIQIAERFSDCGSYEEILDAARSWLNDFRLQIGVQQLGNVIDAVKAGESLSAGAEALLARMFAAVSDEFSQKFGTVRGRGMAIIAMGNFGSHELTMTSDLDLILVYDGQDLAGSSGGSSSLSVQQYYGRLSQRFINALTTLTRQGRLFEVDMRLRPSGNQGPVAASLESFTKYHETSSWTWEQMALSRAHVITGHESLRADIERVIRQTLSRPREQPALALDVDDMRARIDREYKTRNIWSLKYVRGGLIDLEFLVQLYVLSYANQYPEILDVSPPKVIDWLGTSGLAPSDDMRRLGAAYTFQRALQSQIRLCLGAWDSQTEGPTGLRRILGRLNEEKSYEDLTQELSKHQTAVREIYVRVMVGFGVTSQG